MGGTRELGEWHSPRLRDSTATLLVPVGSCEQHGPHLPLDTDTRIARAVADAAAERLNLPVAPAIGYGASGEHQAFPGTVSIGTPALRAVLLEFGRSACHWAGRVAFVNGHGGNVEALRSAVPLLRAEGRDVGWFSCAAAGADAHAGHSETSVLLHLSPQLVDVAAWRVGNTEPLARLMGRLRRGGVAAVSESGILGDPTTATAAAGAAIFAAMVDDGLRRVRRWSIGAAGMLE